MTARLDRRRWVASTGIEKSGDDLRIVLSVPAGKAGEAEQILSKLNLRVPVRIREVGAVRARRSGQLG
ncbi:MAG: hypothetical protein ACREQJ_10425 [Candidatus Binatia bacterium]